MGHNQKLILARQVAFYKGCLDLFEANISFLNYNSFTFCLKYRKSDYFPSKIIEKNKNFKDSERLWQIWAIVLIK